MNKLSQVVKNLEQTSAEQQKAISETWTKTLSWLEADLNAKLRTSLIILESATAEQTRSFQEKHKEALTNYLTEYNQSLTDMQRIRQQAEKELESARKAIKKNWWKPALISASVIITVLASLYSGLWYLSSQLSQASQDLTQASKGLEELEAKGGKIEIGTCNDDKKKKRLCIQVGIDKPKIYGNEQKGYWIVPKTTRRAK